MKKRKIIKIILILVCIVVGLNYYFFQSYYGASETTIQREARNSKEEELIALAEKIKCVGVDRECLDLVNIYRGIFWQKYIGRSIDFYIARVEFANEFAQSSGRLLNKTGYYTYFNNKRESIQLKDCLEQVGSDGYVVNQYYSYFTVDNFHLVFDPWRAWHEMVNRSLFFTAQGDYVCGSQEYPSAGV
jgi:hypothetical protein